jgi:hypothetical protein
MENREFREPQGKDLNRICLRFNDFAHFTVFDYFSHPFYRVNVCLLFANITLPPFDQIL